MKITREFAPADRYLYDFSLCSYANGWAQVDTAQDASHFGTWPNPTRLLIFTYCEGDMTLKEAASPEEFAAELREIDAWKRAQVHGPPRIDPGLDPALKAAFEAPGLRGYAAVTAYSGATGPPCTARISSVISVWIAIPVAHFRSQAGFRIIVTALSKAARTD
jgi:hypothetical protein